MRDFRVVMQSIKAGKDYEFVIYIKALNEHYAVEQANKDYDRLFSTNRALVTEVK